MENLKIEEAHKGESITLRLPKNYLDIVRNLAKIKNTSVNKIMIYLVEFSLKYLDIKDKNELEKIKKQKL